MSLFLLISSLLNFGASVLLILIVYSATGVTLVRRRFMVFLFTIAGWTLGYALWQISSTREAAIYFTSMLIAFAAFIPATFYHLSLTLAEKKGRFFLIAAYLIAAAAVATTPIRGLVGAVVWIEPFGHWPQAGPFLYLVIASYLIYVPMSGITLWNGAREHVGMRASQMNFVLGSASIGFLGGATNFPLWYDISIPPYGNVVVFVYLLMVGYGIYNRRISGISVDIFKSFIYLLLTSSIAMFYVLGMAFYGILSGASFEPREYWFHGVSAFVVSAFLLWAVPKLRNWSEHMLDVLLRKEHLSTVAQLNALPVALSELTDEREIYERTTDALVSILGVSGAAMLTRAQFDAAYKTRSMSGTFGRDWDDESIDLDDPLIRFLGDARSCIVVDQIFDEIPTDAETSLIRLKETFGISTIVPIFSGNTLHGLILLGYLGGTATWSDENAGILFSIGSQLGSNFRARDLERRTNEVDKLVALGTMAAGLSHEIRNPLVSIQTLANLLARGDPSEKLGESFRSVVLRDVKRISSIVEGVAMFSENRTGDMRPLRIGDPIESTLQIYQESITRLGAEVTMAGNLDLQIRGNFDQIVQVLNNLLENSLQALDGVDSPMLSLDVRKVAGGRSESWLELRVADNGPGIPEAIRERIFDPFITSKDTGTRADQKGMGLGLAITKRIIDNHGGNIAVDDHPGGGAVFVISLRCLELAHVNLS